MTEASVIIGGGVAGATAALALSRAGRRVDLYERSSSASHKICGEFMSREVSANLRSLGVDPVDLGARPINRVRLVRGNRSVDQPLPFRLWRYREKSSTRLCSNKRRPAA